jgi:hypothetical protein
MLRSRLSAGTRPDGSVPETLTLSMLGLIGWIWMLPKLEALTWRRGAAQVAANA